ncbi:hypothetical protein [Sphingomonas sp.]|uniref:hypothetical protein n=1 Tax=Sphingomonas sp. TaxID=28214 RepID=UPI0028ACA1E5|nr:hypothetical protein [Sphingomonas sp.]
MKTLAAMFRYCVAPEAKPGDGPDSIKNRIRQREQLHRFLQISVATWAWPDAAHDVSVDRARDQWHSNARALNLNPKGRAQTKKHRPIVPIPDAMARLARQRLGERDWIEGQLMLGHRKTSTSDTYAPFETGYLARPIEVTDSIIAESERMAPGRFVPMRARRRRQRTQASETIRKRCEN